MSYNRFWMLWLAEHAPKSTQYRLNKFGRLTPKIIRDAQKDYFEVNLSKSTASFNEKRKSTIQHRKWANMTFFWFCLHWFAEHTPKSVKYTFTKVGRLTGWDPKEVAKITLRLHFLTGRWVLRKIQRALPHREHWWKWPIFYSGCAGWKSMVENMVNIYVFTKSGPLTGRDYSEEKSFWIYTF